MGERQLLTHDLQSSPSEVLLGLSRAGVSGVQKAIRISYGGSEKLIAADIDCTVERETPVTGLATQEMVSLIGLAAASAERTRRIVGVEASGINACPCAQGLVRERAAERLGEAGFDELDVERILELVPLATHNQRGRGTLFVGTEAPVNAEQLVRIVEGSMSSPVYGLLKRPDELEVVEQAHNHARFVEDSVRLALAGTLEAYDLDDADFLFSRQVNFETIHDHDVVAERFGTVAELRAELDGGLALRHTELREWLA